MLSDSMHNCEVMKKLYRKTNVTPCYLKLLLHVCSEKANQLKLSEVVTDNMLRMRNRNH